jgi:uncharacterized membrane protein YdjX (TVP38/TMEM64 family)
LDSTDDGAKSSSPAARRRVWLLRTAAFLPLGAGAGAYSLHSGFRELLNQGASLLWDRDLHGLKDWAAALGAWAPLATSLLMVVQALAAPLPAVLVTATNSLLFGPFWGGWLSIASATAAAILCYLIARCLGEPVVRGLVSRTALAKADAFFAQHGAVAVLVARLLPFVPFDPVSFVAGLSRLRLWTFFWATFVGQIPAGMAYSYLAQDLDNPLRLVVQALAVFAALLVVGWTARRVLMRR